MHFSLGRVENTYRLWGRNPILYRLGCVVTFSGREGALRSKTVDRLELKRGDTVFDLACGNGLNFGHLVRAVGPEGRIVGFDYSADMLAAARQRAVRRGWRNISLVRGDAAWLSLKGRIDGVLSTLGISAIPDHRKALVAGVGALRDGGRISILDAALPSGFCRVCNPLLGFIYAKLTSWDYRKDIPGDLREILPDVRIERFNAGTIYIVSGRKEAPGR